MRRIAFAVLFVLAGCMATNEVPNYRALAAKTVPTNVELIGTFYNLYTGESQEDAAYCSGVAVSPTEVITAGHCVNSAQNLPLQQGVAVFDGKIKLRLQDGKIVMATIVASHFEENGGEDKARDVALLRVEEGGLSPAEMGDSDTVQVGDQIAIVGNTFGELKHSFTIGVVSYIARHLPVGTFIQTDALSGPGNSGGPVFDMAGKLIGILTRGSGGVSLVLPINDVLAHLGVKDR